MAKGYSFSDRFPKAKLFLFLAVLLALPLTIWSFQKAPTNTRQEAAAISCTTNKGACYPNYYGCPSGSDAISGTCGANLDSQCCSLKICKGLPYVQVWEKGGYTGNTKVWCSTKINTLAGGYYTLQVPNVGNYWNDYINSIKMVNWPGYNAYTITFYFNENYKYVYTSLISYSGIAKTQNIPSVPALLNYNPNDGISSFGVTNHP